MKTDMIETVLEKRLITSPGTRKNYRININNYFKTINKDMDTYFSKKKKLDEYETDLSKVYMQQEKNGKPYLSRKSYFSVIKTFMMTHDKRLADLDFWGILKNHVRGAEPESDECILNQKDIKEILSHGNTCSRAMFLMLASSGRRIGEILALSPGDININSTPATINIKKGLAGKEIRSTKTKQQTLCFMSEEAKEAYLAWMKERDVYLKYAVKKSHLHKKEENDTRIFPMGYDNALFIWKKLINRGDVNSKYRGKDSKTQRDICHPHILRKFYRSYLGDADLAEYLMGHSTMLTRAYRQMKPEDLAEKYMKFMPNVTIFAHTPDLTGINESLKEKDEQIAKLQKQVDELDEFKKKYLEKLILDHENKINGH